MSGGYQGPLSITEERAAYQPLDGRQALTQDPGKPSPNEYSQREYSMQGNIEELAESKAAAAHDLKLAGAKLAGGLGRLARGNFGIEKGSVYGEAVLIPQLARCLGWPRTLTALVVRTFLFYCLVTGLTLTLLTFLAKEERVMDHFAGQMYLCDFGAFMSECNEGESCKGPGGTQFTDERLYSWGQWVTRKFVRDALQSLFPDKADDIASVADIGEYGVESYWCRLICCAVFMASLSSEVDNMIQMGWILWYAPREDRPWIVLKEEGRDCQDTIDHWLDHVTIQVGDIPLGWKVFNVLAIFLPKLTLFILTAQAGVNFLMETGAIDDFIVNCVALNFLLTLDNLCVEALASPMSKRLMDMCEELDFSNRDEVQSYGESWVLDEYHEKEEKFQTCKGFFKFLWAIAPTKLLAVMGLTATFVGMYYLKHCDRLDGKWVSKAMYEPKTSSFTFLNQALESFFPLEQEEKPYWTMPQT